MVLCVARDDNMTRTCHLGAALRPINAAYQLGHVARIASSVVTQSQPESLLTCPKLTAWNSDVLQTVTVPLKIERCLTRRCCYRPLSRNLQAATLVAGNPGGANFINVHLGGADLTLLASTLSS